MASRAGSVWTCRRDPEQALAHLSPLSHVPLSALSAEEVEEWRNALDLAPKSANTYLAVLRTALQVAEDRGHVRRNVAKLVPLRRVPRYRRDAMTAERARAIETYTHVSAAQEREAAAALERAVGL